MLTITDEVYGKAVALARVEGAISVSFLQRKLNLGWGKAKALLDTLEERGIVGPDRGPGLPRLVIAAQAQSEFQP